MNQELGYDDARERIAAAMRPLVGTDTVALASARGRVLASDVVSPIDVPAHDNSAMDGYALHGDDLRGDAATELLAVDATALAGRPFAGPVPRGHCLRIMTGAVLPAPLDTVVPVELCELRGQRVRIDAGKLCRGDNRRQRGEDLAAGAVALQAGRRLRPADLGLIASLGFARVDVFRRLRVALLSTGNEVRAPGQPLRPGEIYDSNRFGLTGALQQIGADVIDRGSVPDDEASTCAAIEQAAAVADVVITSGGAGLGDADLTTGLLRDGGALLFSRVAMQPGRPTSFGQLRRAHGAPAWLFALPGNPVAALVAFHVLARDALLALSGVRVLPAPRLRARAVAPIRKRAGRTEFQRGVVSQAPDGGLEVRLTGAQGSGILRSLCEANALVVLHHDQGPVAAGEMVEVSLLDETI